MKRLSQNEQATLILILAVIFGAWFRLMPAWMAGFPINDGGMFYTMILDLQANHYAPPLFTSYNHLSIPFAYPPLGFYVGALLSDLFHTSPINILRWLPGLINALTIPAFYFFAKEVLKDKIQSATATLVFAFIPHLTSWESMGGGLTRSFGLLFMLLTLGFVQRVFEEKAFQHEGLKGKKAEQTSAYASFVNFVPFVLKKELWGAMIFGGLTVLSHTEAPIFTIAIAVYIWLMKSRSWKGLRDGIVIALGVLLVGGWWYALVIFRHGFAPFQSISQTGAHSLLAVFKILNIAFLTEEPYLGLLATLGILGIASLAVKKNYFIPLMLVAIFLAQPRSAHVIGNIPLALAAGYFIAEILLPAISALTESKKTAPLFIVLGIYIFTNSMYYGLNLARKVLSEPERTAMQWVKENTPKESTFIVLSGDQNAFCDPVTEWFPALSERQSLTTIQGTEWLLDGGFGMNMMRSHRVQACIDEGMDCFQRAAGELGKPFDHVYISISPATKNCELAGTPKLATRGLILSFENSAEYKEIYRSGDVVIFERRK
jgi:hypothetical protein